MKVFLSWSGETSHQVAITLRDWLPSVIQSLEPYVSSEDIEKGARWSTDIAKELEKSSYGILCITRDNMEAPWLNFEAGALSKSVEKGRVSPFLFGLKRAEVKPGPLLQFQSTLADREETLKLLQSLNVSHDPPLLEDARLQTIFDVWWPRLEAALSRISQPAAPAEAKPMATQGAFTQEIVEEILVLLRQQQRILNSPGDLLPPMYLREILNGPGHNALMEGHPVFRDVTSTWRELHSLLHAAMANGVIPSEALRAIDRMDELMRYIHRRFADPRPSHRRLLRSGDLPSPD